MRKIFLLSSINLISISFGFGQSVEITPFKATVKGTEPFLELKRQKKTNS